MATPLAAASAYANVARLAADPSLALARPPGLAGNSETSFASVLKEAMTAVSETGRKSDTQTRAMANGKSNTGRGHRGGGDRSCHRCRGGARQ